MKVQYDARVVPEVTVKLEAKVTSEIEVKTAVDVSQSEQEIYEFPADVGDLPREPIMSIGGQFAGFSSTSHGRTG